jgi:Tfp pilus assembly protein PilF
VGGNSQGRRQSARARVAAANYIAGLGRLGLGETEKARAHFSAALAVLPDDFGARLALEQLGTF